LLDSDSDAGLLSFVDSDDLIGRVTIRLGTLFANTVYDSWFPLDDRNEADAVAAADAMATKVSAGAAPPNSGPQAEKKGAKRGAALRLRYSVTFTTERMRMFSYLSAMTSSAEPQHELAFDPPDFTVSTANYEHCARFAVLGRIQPGVYKWEALMGHIEELRSCKASLESCVASVERVLFWRPGVRLASLLTCVGFQL
jgi:hypothetical protein